MNTLHRGHVVAILLCFIVEASFAQHPIYRPSHLHKVPDDTLISRTRKRLFIDPEKVIIKDSAGHVIAKKEAEDIDYTRYFGDQYANEKGEIVEIVLRKMTSRDRELISKLEEVLHGTEEIVLEDVNCAEAKQLLEQVHDIDQQNRTADKVVDMAVDRENQIKVISLLEKCGWPTKEQVGGKAMQSIFLVIQHASKQIRKKYFPLIKAAGEKGDLSPGAVAVMEDRMLMENGQKQKYGSQLTRYGNGPLTLHPIEDPENVNKRRAAMGLGTIEEYLRHFGIEYHAAEK